MSKDLEKACRFIPVQCTEERFKTFSPQEGYVYFVTDKKKMFLGKNNEFIPMCATSGFFYGLKEIEYDNSGNEPDPQVFFDMVEIEGDDVPEVDDLILNIDGCFYRVVNVLPGSIETKRQTLRGSGGAGGGGGDTPGGTGSFRITVSKTANVFASEATTMPIKFTGFYNGTDSNYISQVSFTIKGEENPFYSKQVRLSFNTEQSIELIDYISLFAGRAGTTTVYVAVQDMYGTERSMPFTIEIVALKLTSTQNVVLSSATKKFIFSYNLSGGSGSALASRDMEYKFYPENDLTTAALTLTVPIGTASSAEGNRSDELDLTKLTHGIYLMKARIVGKINGQDDYIYSNYLTHKMVYNIVEGGNPLLGILIPEKTEQYSNIPISYLFATTAEDTTTYRLRVMIDQVEKTTLEIAPNVMGVYNLYFEETGIYTLDLVLVEAAITYQQVLNITKYTGDLPVIDATRSDLMLYLTPRGRTNDAVDRDSWTDYNGKYSANLTNLYYGTTNGWLVGDQEVSYLRLSSGAGLNMPSFKPFAIDLTKQNIYGQAPGTGFTIELDFSVEGVLNYNSELIKCVSTNEAGVIRCGFSITGDKAYFFNSDKNTLANSLASMDLVEGERIRLTYVVEPANGAEEFPMCYTYLNGILSSAVAYDKAATYKDSANPATLIMDSTFGIINIYGVRFYSSALNSSLVLNNYTASLPTLEERDKKFASNLVLDPATGKVSLAKVSAESYEPVIPYMIITGGISCDKKFKMDLGSEATEGLPTGKKTYRLIDVEIKYPKTDLFADFKDYSCKCEFNSGKTLTDRPYGETATKGAMMYAQGTSSLEYPTKNLRIKFADEEDYLQVRPDLSPVEIICMKADYMESSGSHNTGAANLIDRIYEYLDIATPGQKQFANEEYKTVTCIKGYPCVIFYSPTGAAGSYEYIGKYNLNLDKATPEPFGFKYDDADEDFGYLHNEVGELVYNEKGEKINAIHCFEFLDNAVKVCNFLPKEGMNYHDTWYLDTKNKDDETVPGWAIGFESRYPEDLLGTEDADSLYPLASWLNSLYNLYNDEIQAGKRPENITYNYRYEETQYDSSVITYYYQEGDEWIEIYLESAEEFAAVGRPCYKRYIESSRFEMDSLERFKREYQCHLDKDFLLSYYLITETLLMADSRVKNMMIATWGPEKRSYIDLNGVEQSTFNYIFYPIFYDMDTMLGLDNTGHVKFDYYAENTDPSVFNGDEVLWNFVRDSLHDELVKYYTRMEDKILTSGSLLPYFSENQANLANEAFYNGDAMYKYVDKFRTGYIDHSKKPGEEGYEIAPGKAPYLYAAQGDRTLMRKYFLTNRVKFLRGKYRSTDFKTEDRLKFRFNFPTADTTDEALRQSIQYVPADGVFRFTGLRPGFAGLQVGANGPVSTVRLEENVTTEFTENVSSASGTEAYILGISNLSDFGDLSAKYLQNFIFEAEDIRLKSLKLGNANKYYNNTFWTNDSVITLDGCSYLEDFNLQNCPTFGNNLDFSKCLAIKNIDLTGSSTSRITLPPNSIIETLHLPTTITDLTLDNCQNLDDVDFSLGNYNYGSALEIGQGSYSNDFTNISKLKVINTPINSYNIVRSAHMLEEYTLQGINWVINESDTQYAYHGLIETNEANIEYYYYDNGEYKVYTDSYPSTKNLYTKHTLIAGSEITEIPVLEFLKNKATYDNIPKAQALTGTITIDIAGSVDEFALYQKYHAIYPNLTFAYNTENEDLTVAPASTITFYRLDAADLEGVDINDITPYYTALTDGSYTLETLISRNGPVGSELTPPVKVSTDTHVYTFTGVWQDWASNKIEYYQDSYFENTSDWDAAKKSRLFSSFKPTANMKLVPVFEESDRYYTITFNNYDRSLLVSKQLLWQESLAEKMDIPAYLYRDDSELDEEIRWTFKGWISAADFAGDSAEPIIINVSALKATGDATYYAYFVQENVRTAPTDSQYFNFVRATGEGASGYEISIKDEYRNLLQGKITLPARYNNADVVAIGDFKNMPKITEVYCENGSQYVTITDNKGFQWTTNVVNGSANEPGIKAIYLPNTMRSIGAYAFYCCRKLEHITLNDNITHIGRNAFSGKLSGDGEGGLAITMQLHLSELPYQLNSLGSMAFRYGGPNITLTSLPNGLNKLENQVFTECEGLKIAQLGDFGVALSEIDTFAFYGCEQKVSTLIIAPSITHIASSGDSVHGLSLAYSSSALQKVESYSASYQTRESLQAVGLTGNYDFEYIEQ